MITVAMPTWNTPPGMLRDAVESVLAQTAPLTLVVVDDASTTDPAGTLADITDDRLIVHRLPDNRGCYHAESLVLAACTTPYWTVHAADDISLPGRYTRLLDTIGDHLAAAHPCVYHNPAGLTGDPIRPRPPGHATLTTIARHPAHLYRTDALREIGIPTDLRGSLDTAIVSLFWHRHQVATHPHPDYIIRRWGGSLTAAPTTRLGSDWRRRQRAERRARFNAALPGGPLPGPRPAPADVAALSAALA